MEYIRSQEAQILETMGSEPSSDPEVAKHQEYSAIYLGRIKQEVEFLKTRVELRQRDLEIEEKLLQIDKERLDESLQFAKQTGQIEKERLEMSMKTNEQEMQLLEMKHTLVLMELAAKGESQIIGYFKVTFTLFFRYSVRKPPNVTITEPTLALTQGMSLVVHRIGLT